MEEQRALMKGIKESQKSLLASATSASEGADTLTASLIEIRRIYLQLQGDEIPDSLFKGVFKHGNNSKALVAALMEVGAFLTGFTPILGQIVALIQTVKNIIDAYQMEAQKLNAADEVDKYLQTYALTAVRWSLTTQIVIDTINALVDGQPLSIEKSSASLTQRITDLGRGWNYQQPILSRE
jgi:hypothetical protein